jgi:S-formylglutathione hydrolase FrmB
VSASTVDRAVTLWSQGSEPWGHQIGQWSLINGWVPAVVEAVAVLALAVAIVGRARRWYLRSLPWALVIGLGVAICALSYARARGISGDPALWIWIGLAGTALGVLAVGWDASTFWVRGLSVAAIPLCLLCAALALNSWVGYLPTVQIAWNQLTSGPLPDQINRVTLAELQRAGRPPAKGVVVPVTISAEASRFPHRGELVYLPPAWFASVPSPQLPVVMMVGAEMNTPADWLRVGAAATTMDDFATAHGGYAPVLVFVDPTGAFKNDTECVNGSRGNAADHLTKDVVPYMISSFGVSANPANWAVAGWSMGGTCAIDLVVMHPELFKVFVDIAGDMSPSTGTKAQTIGQLFGGNADAWAAFDPATVMTRHAPYIGVSGLFAVPVNHGRQNGDAPANPEGQDLVADSLCSLGATKGIRCAVVAQPGKHDWPYAARAFASALPWLAGELGSPQASQLPLPVTAAGPNTRPSSAHAGGR